MDTAKLDELRANYKAATEQWVAAIRAEEALAARDLYKDELRKIDYGF
ncbi:MAG: hypothetical protein ABSD98_00605 [Candidatus Korobacteraceae bacterium]